jgi:hypothetical protein
LLNSLVARGAWAIVLNQHLPTNSRRAKTLPVLTWDKPMIGQYRQGYERRAVNEELRAKSKDPTSG